MPLKCKYVHKLFTKVYFINTTSMLVFYNLNGNTLVTRVT